VQDAIVFTATVNEGVSGTIDSSVTITSTTSDPEVDGNDSGFDVQVLTHTLTITVVGSGTVTPSVGSHSYIHGEVVPITAAADADWVFDGWQGDVANADSPTTTVTMNADKTITATFIKVSVPTYTLDVNVEPTDSGSVALDPSGGIYDEGTVVTLTASADTGWAFDSWTGDLVNVVDTDIATVTMNADKVITATFTEVGTCVEVTDVALTLQTSGDIYTDTEVEFRADIAPDDADTPYTYTIDYGSGADAPQISSDDPLMLNHTFANTGTHTVEIAVWNCGMTTPVTDSVSVMVGVPTYNIYLPLVLRNQ
jgi:hypothetical protein